MKPHTWFLLILATGLAACKTPAVPDYTVSRDSLFYLQQIPPTQVSVGPITGGDGTRSRAGIPHPSLTCSPPRGGTGTNDAGEYIRAALIKELSAAGRYTEAADAVQIGGSVEHVSLSRKIPFGAVWSIGLRLQSSTGAALSVEEEFRFDTGSLAGSTVCKRAIEHFEPAVRAVLEKAIRSEQFRSLVEQG